MLYVKIKPHPDCPKSPCGTITYVECGKLSASGHPFRFCLHEGSEGNIPAWAAADLVDRGHVVTEVNEIKGGAHAAIPEMTHDQIDMDKLIDVTPPHELDRFLQFHGHHDHLGHLHRPNVRSNLRGVTASFSGARPWTEGELRAKARDLHAEHVAAKAKGA